MGNNTKYNIFSYAYPTLNWGVFGFNVIMLTSDNVQSYTSPDNTGSMFGLTEMGYQASYSNLISEAISVGIDFKAIYKSLFNKSSLGYGADAGMIYNFNKDFNIGCSIRNFIQPRIQLESAADVYPVIFGVGLQHEFFYDKLKVNVDLTKNLDKNLEYQGGITYNIKDYFSLSVGYNTDFYAIGFNYNYNLLDISYTAKKSVLSLTHWLSMMYKFGHSTSYKKNMEKFYNYLERGTYYYERGQYEKAIEEFKEALKIDPTNVKTQWLIKDTRHSLSIQHYLKEAEALAKAGKFNAGIKKINKFLDSNPNPSDVKKAKKLLVDYDRQKKIQEHLNNGIKYYLLLNDAGARSEMEKVLVLDSTNDIAKKYLNKSQLRTKMQKLYKEAVQVFKKGDYESALSLFNELLKLNPDHTEAKDYVTKIKNIQKVLTLKNKGIELFHKKKYEAASRFLKTALELKSDETDAKKFLILCEKRIRAKKLFVQGLKLYAAKKYSESLSYLDEAVLLDPESKMYKDKLDDVRQRLKVKENLMLAQEYFENKEFSQAEKLLKEILEIDKNNKQAKDLMNSIKRKRLAKTQYQQAKSAYEKGDLVTALKKFNLSKNLDKKGTYGKESSLFTDKIAKELQVNKLVKAAVSSYNKKKYAVANKLLERALSIDPGNVDAVLYYNNTSKKLKSEEYIKNGLTNLGRKDYRAAKKNFEKALEVVPDNKSAMTFLEKVEKLIELDRLMNLGKKEYLTINDEKAKAYFQKVIELSKEDKDHSIENIRGKAQKFIDTIDEKLKITSIKDQIKEALQEKNYERIIQLSKKLSNAEKDKDIKDIINKAKIQLKVEDFLRKGIKEFYLYNNDEALKIFNIVLKLDKNNEEAKQYIKEIENQQNIKKLMTEGTEKFFKHEDKNAMDIFRKLVTIDPDNQTAREYLIKAQRNYYMKEFIGKGKEYLSRKEYLKALNNFYKAKKYHPDDKYINFLIDQTLVEQKELKSKYLSKGDVMMKQYFPAKSLEYYQLAKSVDNYDTAIDKRIQIAKKLLEIEKISNKKINEIKEFNSIKPDLVNIDALNKLIDKKTRIIKKMRE